MMDIALSGEPSCTWSYSFGIMVTAVSLVVDGGISFKEHNTLMTVYWNMEIGDEGISRRPKEKLNFQTDRGYSEGFYDTHNHLDKGILRCEVHCTGKGMLIGGEMYCHPSHIG